MKRKILAGLVALTLGTLTSFQVAQKREIHPEYWFDIDQDGTKDAIVLRRNEYKWENTKHWVSDKIESIKTGEEVESAIIADYTIGFISGKNIEKRGDKYLTSSAFTDLGRKIHRVDGYESSGERITDAGYNEDGFLYIKTEQPMNSFKKLTKYERPNQAKPSTNLVR